MKEVLDIEKLIEENNYLKQEIENMTIMMNELEQTNSNLVLATWRERELKRILSNTLAELEKSKNLIEIQNKKISESINYAKRIQDVILPSEKNIQDIIHQSFILYIPKDVVSGDFPFLYHDNQKTYVAAVDCTGHGVPGAMLSLIGHLILHDILSKNQIQTCSEILQMMHNMIVKTLKQDVPGNDASDGMDIALCEIDLTRSLVKFSGAHRSLYQISNNQLIEHKGSRLPIGGMQYKNKSYVEYTIDAQKDDLFLIFSDGYQDQFGGPENEKFGTLRLQEFLLKNSQLPLPELKEAIRNEFLEWKKDNKQMDDILFIGFKIH